MGDIVGGHASKARIKAGMRNMERAARKSEPAMPAYISEDKYPYGLNLRLEHDDLKKLGVSKMPAAGAKLEIRARGHVSGSTETDMKGAGKRRSMSVQLTHLNLKHGG